MIDRAVCTTAFYEAVAACDPAARVREALERHPVRGANVIGLAIGKAAIAMARGAGAVARGLVVVPHADAARYRDVGRSDGRPRQWVPADLGPGAPPLPGGWTRMEAGHPVPDETSLAAGAAAIVVVETAGPDDVVLALVSGGASALVEQPRQGLRFDDMRGRVQALMASGAPIHELNRLRTELSAIKGGRLAARSKAPVVTLVVSDVIGDDPRVIGSGPTVREPAHDGDRVEVIAPMSSFGVEIVDALAARGVEARRIAEPIADDVAVVADRLVAELGGGTAMGAGGDVEAIGGEATSCVDDYVLVAWGEPTVRVVESAGSGGRAQQLALELAKRLRGTTKGAFVAGSDGVDGPSPRGAAGAFVDGATWDAIAAAGIDPAAALARCDAGTALDAVGALVVTGPTGINHADIVIIG